MLGMRGLAAFLRANPQVFVLLVICVVLGLGTFIAVLVALATSGSSTSTGEPSGAIMAFQALVG
jgi:ABC-type phosphate/phosphonate transport system permease subunit